MMGKKNFYFDSAPTNSAFSENSVNAERMSDLNNDSSTGVQITVMSSKEIVGSGWFPKTATETIYFGEKIEKLYIEIRDGQWFACCIPPAFFQMADRQRSREALIYDRCLYAFCENENYYILYAEITDADSAVFHNYHVNIDTQICIGRASSNDLVYPNRSASKEHAVLKRTHNGWQIWDCNSVNGVFVNKKRIKETFLKVGDCVFIVGLRLLIGIDFISINDGNQRIFLSTDALTSAVHMNKNDYMPETAESVDENILFTRSPRHRRSVSEKPIEIEAPPMSLNSNQIPMLLRMGGSAVMGGAAAMAGDFLPLITSLLFPALTQRYTEKEKKEYETRRVAKYTEYLKKKENEILFEKVLEQEILNQNYPPIGDILNYSHRNVHLWERRTADDDFLHIRLGRGKLPLMVKIKYPDHRFNMDEDELENQMFQLAEREVSLENVPITVSLTEHFVIGMKGNQQILFDYMKNMLMQTVLLHSYDELKLVLLTDSVHLSQIEWVKYLPHFWDDRRTMRFIATELSEAYQISEYLKSQIEDDVPKPRELEEILAKRPYYLIFAVDKKLLDSLEILTDIMRMKKNCGVTIVTVYDMPPKDSSLLLELGKDDSKVMYINQTDCEEILFESDIYAMPDAEMSMRRLANISLKAFSESYALPQAVTFLELYGVGQIAHLQPEKRWRESDPVKSLAVPVGIGTDGLPIQLDLHEKFHGPHGLVAGTTGSGKSEFILTYILSMAINFHPDEVAFVLIDYKGGGLAGAFVDEERGIHLPHVAGTITNLDGSAIARSLISLQSELTRRQKVFNQAKSIANEGTMDIYAYQRLYRRGIVKEPMPHLFIISDEFAELKTQEPEFMDRLISIARIGRSLGIHLILATQKPAGIVNDQIRSNAKFKVCLKVQDRADSMDMLQRAEAAELKETGRFYLQVGYNESFVLGQSGWSGAPYEVQEKAVVQKDKSVQFIDMVGQVYYTGNQTETCKNADGTQLTAIVEMLSKTAESLHIQHKMLWKPALKEKIGFHTETMHVEKHDSGISVTIGMLDDPEYQMQMPFVFDFMSCRNLLIAGEGGSGKTTLLQTMLLQLIKHFSTEQIQFYILDYSGRKFGMFQSMPHCGAVLNEENEDSLDAFFELINGIVEERKRLFVELEADSYESANKMHPLPVILVVIDNMAGFAALKKGDDYCRRLQDYLKISIAYGVKYILTCSHLNEILMRTRQEIGTHISLYQKSKYDYGDVLGCRCEYMPPELPGRGMALLNGRPLEFQAAMFEPELEGYERAGRLREYMQSAANANDSMKRAKRLPHIPETLNYKEFHREFLRGRIPLGYSVRDAKPVALPLKQWGMFSLYFGNPIGKNVILKNLLYAAGAEHMAVTVLKKTHDSSFESGNSEFADQMHGEHLTVMDTSQETLVGLWKDLVEELKGRKGLADAFCEEHKMDVQQKVGRDAMCGYIREHTQPLLILFESFSEACLMMDDASAKVFSGLLQENDRFNLYFAGCFYPRETGAFTASSLYTGFHPGEFAMLFGGRLSEQTLCTMPVSRNEKAYSEMQPYNQCIVRYQEQYYPLVMPCGELMTEEWNEDDMPIFAADK